LSDVSDATMDWPVVEYLCGYFPQLDRDAVLDASFCAQALLFTAT